MGAPVVPNDFKGCISDPSSGLCANFVASLLKLPVLLWKLVNYLFDSGGNPTKAFTNQVMPTGSLIFSAVTLTTGTSFLLCDGSDVSQATYPDLFAALGTTYGTSTPGNFKLPDYRAKFPVGIGSFPHAGTISVGTALGADQVTLTEAELATHAHGAGKQYQTPVQRGSADTMVLANSNHGDGNTTLGNASTTPGSTDPDGSSTPFNIIPPALGVYIYIVT